MTILARPMETLYAQFVAVSETKNALRTTFPAPGMLFAVNAISIEPTPLFNCCALSPLNWLLLIIVSCSTEKSGRTKQELRLHHIGVDSGVVDRAMNVCLSFGNTATAFGNNSKGKDFILSSQNMRLAPDVGTLL